MINQLKTEKTHPSLQMVTHYSLNFTDEGKGFNSDEMLDPPV